jgi:hypothetical protein
MSRSKTSLLAACAALFISPLFLTDTVTHAAPKPAPIQASFVVQPEAGQPTALIGLGYFFLQSGPETNKTLSVVLKNTGKVPLTIRNYLVDGTQILAGGIGYSSAGTKLTGVGGWISMNPTSELLVPGQTGRVVATIHTPMSLAPGEYVGGLAFEDTSAKIVKPSGQFVISLHYREVIPIVVSAPGKQIYGAKVGGVMLTAAGKGSQAGVTIRNTGNVRWRGQGTLQVGGKHSKATSFPFMVGTILPGASASINISMANVQVQPGSYALSVQLQPGEKSPLISWKGLVALTLPQKPVGVGVPTPRPVVALQPAVAAARAVAQAAANTTAPTAQGISPIIFGGGALLLIVVVGLAVLVGRRSAAKPA